MATLHEIWKAVRKKLAAANLAGRSLEVHGDAVHDSGYRVTRQTSESALFRQFVQRQRNAVALAATEACFQKCGAENKTDSLASIVNRVSEHSNSNGSFIV